MLSLQWLMSSGSFLFVLLFVSSVHSQTDAFNPIIIPRKSETVEAGTTFTLVWEPTPKFGSLISIQLLVGSTSRDLEDGPFIVSNINTSTRKFAWKIPKDLEEWDLYGLRLSLDSDPSIYQYSYPFKITFDGSSIKSEASSSQTTLRTTTSEPIESSTFAASATGSGTGSGAEFSTESSTESSTEPSIGSGTETTFSRVFKDAAETGGSSTSSSSTSSSTTSSTNTPSQTAAPTDNVSMGAKIGIAVGATMGGVIIFAVGIWFLFRYAKKKYLREAVEQSKSPTLGKVEAREAKSPALEMSAARILTADEKKELENRRRAAELDGGMTVDIKDKLAGERDELEAWRKAAKQVHEMG